MSKSWASSARPLATCTIWRRSLRAGGRRAVSSCSRRAAGVRIDGMRPAGAAGDRLGLRHRRREEDPLAARHRRHDHDRACPGRIGLGATQHCAHGKGSTVHESSTGGRSTTSPGTSAPRSAPWSGRWLNSRRSKTAARICRCAARSRRRQSRADGAGADDPRLAMAKKLVSDQRASKVALERLVDEETAAFT